MRKRHTVVIEDLARHQQPAGEPLLQRVRRIANAGLGGLHQEHGKVAMKDFAEGWKAIC